MKYVSRLLADPEFERIQREIRAREQNRIYCHHELSHALDVCRLAWILYLEAHAGAPLEAAELMRQKELFYVTGLLHDIGRACQYETGEHHESAGVRIARNILQRIDYPREWMAETLAVVGEHHGRSEEIMKADTLAYYIRRADHLSRNCFFCEAAKTCKWTREERNRTIVT